MNFSLLPWQMRELPSEFLPSVYYREYSDQARHESNRSFFEIKHSANIGFRNLALAVAGEVKRVRCSSFCV
nr:hypothetical protein Iba_chr04cCG6580 [Ipomoea batatas]GMC88245.1 hypothetical protein Iba_chr04eCG8260 [Ipomoea batatas]